MSVDSWNKWIMEPLFYEKDGSDILRIHWTEKLFIENIFPILKRNGFQLVVNQEKIIRKFLWFWQHLSLCGYNTACAIAEPLLGKNSSRILSEYYDIFNYKLNHTVFEYLQDSCSASEGAFDDTFLGRRLLSELPAFLWSHVDIVNSKEFVKHEIACAQIEEAYKQLEEGDMSIEELDRRRMMKNKGYDFDYSYDKHA